MRSCVMQNSAAINPIIAAWRLVEQSIMAPPISASQYRGVNREDRCSIMQPPKRYERPMI